VKGKNFLLIPYTPDINDFHFFSNRFSTSNQFYEYMKDSFDTLYNEGKENPKLMMLEFMSESQADLEELPL